MVFFSLIFFVYEVSVFFNLLNEKNDEIEVVLLQVVYRYIFILFCIIGFLFQEFFQFIVDFFVGSENFFLQVGIYFDF